MKKYLFSLFILFSSLDSFSQVTSIDSFYLPGSEWKWRNSSHAGLTGSPCKNIFYSHKIERDSIINGMNYHLVSAREIGTNDCIGGSPLNHINSDIPIFAGIRVDGRQVYLLLFDTLSTVNTQQPYVGPSWRQQINSNYTPGVEEVIYDFDLNIGSTLSWRPGVMVSAIDSVALTNGDSLKIYSFTGASPNDKWIEGIGSTANFFSTQPTGSFTGLVCYSGVPGSYRHESINCTYLTIAADVKKHEHSNEELILYPNPLNNDVLQFKAGKAVNTISITDISGKVIEQHTVSSTQQSVHTSLSTGLYFIKVHYIDGGTTVQKLLKL